MVALPRARAETIVVILPPEIDMANADRVGEDLDAGARIGRAGRSGAAAPRAWRGGHGRPCGTSRRPLVTPGPLRALTGETGARVTRLGGPGGTVGEIRDDLT
jgi:hypothetical protein